MSGIGGSFSAELEVAQFPQQARWKVLKDVVKRVEEATGAAVTSKGVFVAQGKQLPLGERHLFLLIEATSALAVKKAKAELLRSLEEETLRIAGSRGGGGGGGGLGAGGGGESSKYVV